MKKITFIMLMVFLYVGVLFSGLIEAQDSGDPSQNLEDLRDPFLSQLPPPKIVEQPKAVVKPSETVKPMDTHAVELPVIKPEPIQPPNISSFTLKGLVWNTETPQAIVNDKVVRVGDQVNGLNITSIRQEGVEFSNGMLSALLKPSSPIAVSNKKQ